MLPGSTEEIVIPALELASGRRLGEGLGVAYNPEFLREGSSLSDFQDPPFTIIGGHDPTAASAVEALFASVSGERFTVPYRVAEMVKYTSNAFHALKVTFANEIGVLCKAQGIDSHQLMDLFARDRKLNISAAYLRPGFAFGGSCLPKDLRALLYQAHRFDLEAPVLEAILPSNRDHVERAYTMVRATGARRIAVLGFSFKAGTDDLRESPVVELIERLIGKGLQVVVYDRSVSLAALSGSNRAFIEREIPHIASIMVETIDEAIAQAEVVIVGNPDPEFQLIAQQVRPEQRLIDLVRVRDAGALGERYAGVAW
jgi:GDP-mannose 6-dehydrogenase